MIRSFLKFSFGSILAAAISLFTTPMITALINPADFGKASMFTLAFSFLLQIVLLGIDQAFVRYYYQQKSDQEIKTLLQGAIVPALVSLLGVGVLLIIFYPSVSRLMVNEVSLRLVLILIATLFAGLFERYAFLLIRMQQKGGTFSFLRVAAAVVNFLVLYIYAKMYSADFNALIIGNLVALVLSAVVAMALSSRFWVPSFQRIDYKYLLRYGLPFIPTFMAAWVFEGIDKIMLRNFASYDELGLFSASFKFVAILNIVQTAFSTFWLPISMEMYEKNSENANLKFSKAFSLMSAILFLGGVGLILFKNVLMLLFDKSYENIDAIMPFLLLIPIMYTLSEITVGGINYSKKTYWHLVIAVASCFLNFGLNFVLLPKLGAKGAAISTGISYIAFFLLRTYFSNKYFKLNISWVKFFLAVLVFIFVGIGNSLVPGFDRLASICGLLALLLIYRTELQGIFQDFIRPKLYTQ